MSDENIIPFERSGDVGDGHAFEADHILEQAKGTFEQVVVCGFTKDGEIVMRASHGSRESLWILRRAEHHLLFETERCACAPPTTTDAASSQRPEASASRRCARSISNGHRLFPPPPLLIKPILDVYAERVFGEGTYFGDGVALLSAKHPQATNL